MKFIDLFGKGKYNKIKEISDLEKQKLLIEDKFNQEITDIDYKIKRMIDLGEAEQKASKAFGKDIKLK